MGRRGIRHNPPDTETLFVNMTEESHCLIRPALQSERKKEYNHRWLDRLDSNLAWH